MIDEYWTWEFYGYHSDELKPHSHKPIVARCDGCCQYRVITIRNYRSLCHPCASKLQIGTHHTEETRGKISKKLKGRPRQPFSDEWCHNISESRQGKNNPFFGKHHTDTTKQRMSKVQKGRTFTEEARQKISATLQGIPYEEWTGFVSNGEYCEKFDEACRERIREKYDRTCFLCGKHESEEIRKLSVHHYDMNKNQGCNGSLWKLVPLCMSCHGKSHDKVAMSRIEYVLENDVIIL